MMTVKELRDLLYEVKDDDQVVLCNVMAPLSAALPVADVTIVKQGMNRETSKAKVLIMFDTRKEGNQ